MLVSQVEGGLISQEAYMKFINKELEYEKYLLEGLIAGGSKKEHIQRVQKRIQLIQDEISGTAGEEAAQPEVEGVVSKPEAGKIAEEIKSPAAKQERQKALVKEGSLGGIESGAYEPTAGISEIFNPGNIDFSKVDMQSLEVTKKRLDEYEAAIAFLQHVKFFSFFFTPKAWLDKTRKAHRQAIVSSRKSCLRIMTRLRQR